LLEGGVMSDYLTSRAAPGDVIRCNGPQGTFYLRGGTRPILMVAGGTGVAPMISMLRQMIASGERRPVTLCFGVNRADDFFLADELAIIAKSMPSFDHQIAIAQGAADSEFHSGVVTELIFSRIAPSSDIYLCGPPAMTDQARIVLAECGAESSSIFAERFVPTAGSGSQVRTDPRVSA
jgi:NAD(P)H-flavin reductase